LHHQVVDITQPQFGWFPESIILPLIHYQLLSGLGDYFTHYINAHRYLPPNEFCEAVLSCPPTQTMEYKRRFLENGGREILKEETTTMQSS